MEQINITIASTNDEINELEVVRYKAFNMKERIENNYYERMLKNKTYIALKCCIDNKLVGGVYLSQRNKYLNIESIFVDPIYQNNELHIGSYIVKYIMNNKEFLEAIFNTEFEYIALESREQDQLYEKLGFKHTKIGTMIYRYDDGYRFEKKRRKQ